MKQILFIILFTLAPMLTERGLQIGEITINNKIIKIMKMNFCSPIWLQSGSNRSRETYVIRFVFAEGGNMVKLSSNTPITIESIQGGQIVTEKHGAVTDGNFTINADANSEVSIFGAVTKFSGSGIGMTSAFKRIDVSGDPILSVLDIGGSTSLTNIDLSNNPLLSELDLYMCSGLEEIDFDQNTLLKSVNLNNCSGLEGVDLTNAKYLETCGCSSCEQMSVLILNENAPLSYVDLNFNTALAEFACPVTNQALADGIVNWFLYWAPNNGYIQLRYGDEYNQMVVNAATEKGWEVGYYDTDAE